MVNVGDQVVKNQVLINGCIAVNDKIINVNVLAKVSIITENTFTYSSVNDNEETFALIFAEEFYGEKETISSKVKKEKINNEFIYTVTLKHKVVLIAG